MEKKGYQEDMEEWQKDLKAAREQVSRRTSFSQLGFYRIVVLFALIFKQ